jgi:Restriction endonuclease
MNALLQRLKELDPATFEELCFQIWSERLPGAGLRRVEGKAGDKGADLFAGILAGKPVIWQCKFFKDGIKDVQKKQIKHSLKTALKNLIPSLDALRSNKSRHKRSLLVSEASPVTFRQIEN